MWANLYPIGSNSRAIIDGIQNTYYLVNLVDNDYVAGNCLFRLLDRMEERLSGNTGDSSGYESVRITDLRIIQPRADVVHVMSSKKE